MKKTLPKKVSNSTKSLPLGDIFVSRPSRMLEWIGGVNDHNLSQTISSIKSLLKENREEEIQLLINSHGGATGIGMSFHDTMHSLLRPNLTTIGSGDVDSSGVIILLSGTRRFLTRNTTLLLHLAGRNFGTDKRFSTLDMENLLKGDKLKDYQYACVVSNATNGRLHPEDVLEMMKNETVLNAEEAVNMGLAHKVLD